MQYEDEEVWKNVVGYEGLYEVSSHGRVRSVRRLVNRSTSVYSMSGKIRKLTLKGGHNQGYLLVSLCRDGHKQLCRVHRLVAEAFLEKPLGCDVVNHLDNIRDNNHYLNLEWTTMQGNSQHAVNQGRNHIPDKGEASVFAVHSLETVLDLRVKYKTFKDTVKDLAREEGIAYTTLLAIIKRETWNFPEAFPEYYDAL